MEAAPLAVANAQDDKGTWEMKKSGWLMLTPAEGGQVHHFAEDYKNYLTVARTAQSSTREMRRRARAAGFAEFTDASQIKPINECLVIPHFSP